LTLMLYASLCQAEEVAYETFDIDDQGTLAQTLRYAIKGKWKILSNKSLPFDEFTQKGGLQHLLFKENPYSGWYGQWDDNGKLRNLRHFSNGILEGPVFSWRENGNKFHQGYYKVGRKNGIFVFWGKNLTKIREQNFKAGKLDGVCTAWYENGSKSALQTFSEGKILSAIGWKPNGERCPSTEVIDGVGIIISYTEGIPDATTAQTSKPNELFVIERYENGNKREEGYYMNGKKAGLWIYYRPDGTEFFRKTYRTDDYGATPLPLVKPDLE
jgi:antitoxin component YwqK of YwqJK toxin-antitoxin module